MVAAAALDALDSQGTHIATVEDVVDAVRQVMAVEGMAIASSHLKPSVLEVIATDGAIDIGSGHIIHIATHNEVSRRGINRLSQGTGIIATQGKRAAHAFQRRELDTGRHPDGLALAETQVIGLKPEVHEPQLLA